MRAKDYPAVFKHSLEPSVFEQIIRVLSRYHKECGGDEAVAKHVYGISKVPRVSAMTMFLNSTDKTQLEELVNAVVEKSEHLKSKQKNSIRNVLL